mgnify:CR=1 FL=1
MKDFKNKVVIVTGASSGIGEAMAKVYAAQGAKVVLGARNVQKLQLLAGDIRARGGQAAYCGVDVTKPEECRELIETAVREFGGIDVLICNAGISMRAIFDVMGIRNIVAKSHGSSNPYNMVRATLDALSKLRSPSEIAAKRGKTVEELIG